jgi:hypothetical protein
MSSLRQRVPVEGGSDAVTREPGVARDRLPEKAAAAGHEKVRRGTVARNTAWCPAIRPGTTFGISQRARGVPALRLSQSESRRVGCRE